MNTHLRWARPGMVGAIVLLAAIVALFAYSLHLTAGLDTNLKAAGINPQSLHVYNPVTGKPISG
jgi:hypothetical protein